jgi:RimJ/RimL family protein N-acetyltransferase
MIIEYKIKTAAKNDILMHLEEVDDLFKPKLSSSINLEEFSDKIFNKCITFEAWNNNKLIGLLSGYYNDQSTLIAFWNHWAVNASYHGIQCGIRILKEALNYGKEMKFKEINLEVNKNNTKVIEIYSKSGAVKFKENDTSIFMKYIL